jgi:valyl-tRNA synthetase
MALHIQNLARLNRLSVSLDYHPAAGQFVSVLKDMHLAIPLSGIVDISGQKKRIEEKIKKCAAELKDKKAILANANFIRRAPREIVAKEKDRLKELIVTLEKLKVARDGLQ